ncbi:MAG: hypothetical protein K2Q21_12065 [Chitinophagaceae bacterium]|nr:hypothetical protein [Chitinophagaceae bacterium]
MEAEWHKIISFNGSQANAFEELVCQIAMEEKSDECEHFERVGTPDGGVECYWQSAGGKDWGWQAKYYQTLTSAEWNNIKKSLFDAAETHPRLTTYYICLPHNLSDGRRGKKTQRDNWEGYKKKWSTELKLTGKEIDIVLWNSTLLFAKLNKTGLHGTRAFFFNQIEIKEQQLNVQLDNSILSLGPKYSSALNLKIKNIIDPFNALARNHEFKDDFTKHFDSLLIDFRKVITHCERIKGLQSYIPAFSKSLSTLLDLFSKIDFTPQKEIAIQPIVAELKAVEGNSRITREAYLKLEEEYKKEKEAVQKNKKDNAKSEYDYRSTSRYKNETEIEHLQKFNRKLDEFRGYLEGSLLKIANEGILVLRGNWGTGKSHLLADVATEQKKQNIPVIFMLGMQFPEIPPRNFIQQSICPKYSLEDYLAALDSLAKSKNQRMFFIIDAINEGKGKFIWRDNIQSLINEFKQYKWLGLILSYRTTYEKLLLPEGFTVAKVTHQGFKGMEDYAIHEFFNFYKIQQTVPLLNPEFSTPLFLKIFCTTLKNLGLSKVEEGYEGISKIFGSFVQSINEKIGNRLDYPFDKVNPVQKAIDSLIHYQLKTGDYVIPYETAHDLVESAISKYSTQKNFLEELLKENLLVEDYLYNPNSLESSKNGISFSYERMIDHFKAKYLIDGNTIDQIKKQFNKGGKLYKQFFDRMGFHGLNSGVLNSLAVLLPEKFNIELYEIVQLPQDGYANHYLYKAIMESILWRRSNTTSEKLWIYIKEYLNKARNEEIYEFYNAIFHVCANKVNYFNADFIHGLLLNKTIADRDVMWSIPIGRVYDWYDDSSVKKIINWCWNKHIDEYNIDDNTAISLGKILAWFFTNSNRYVRDRSTKAFTALYTTRIHLLKSLINDFKDVNDPYVLERVMAGSYGAIARSNDNDQIGQIAQYVYDLYFKTSQPPINILTRDYCKGIVEIAIGRKITLKYKKENLYPPFKSVFPKNIPDEAWVKSLDIKKEKDEKYTDKERGLFRILQSVGGMGDFSRYIIGTNHRDTGSFAAYTLKSKNAYESLIKTLRGNKKKMFEIYSQTVSLENENTPLGKNFRHKFPGDAFAKELEFVIAMQKDSSGYLKEKLASKDFRLFKLAAEYIKKGLPYERLYDMPKFNLGLIERYVLKRVFELGWKMDFFGEYDSTLNEHGRSATKSERIGKKYQWIAYHEMMALLTDHYDYIGRYSYDNEKQTYIGAWQEGLRDIDPSILFKSEIKESDDDVKKRKENWWFTLKYNCWGEDRKEWLANFNDIPDIKKLVEVTDPQGHQWYSFFGSYTWESEPELGTTKHASDRKDVWLRLYTFLINKKDRAAVVASAIKKLYWIDNEIPEKTSYYGIHHGELYNSDAYRDSVSSHRENDPYSEISIDGKPIGAIKTIEEFSIGGEYDCSTTSSRLLKPANYLFDFLDAKFGSDDSCIYDNEGNIIGYDTSGYFNEAHSCFLINKNIVDKKLSESNLELIWHFFGEKEDIGSNVSYVYRMLFSGFAGQENNELKLFPFFKKEGKAD